MVLFLLKPNDAPVKRFEIRRFPVCISNSNKFDVKNVQKPKGAPVKNLKAKSQSKKNCVEK